MAIKNEKKSCSLIIFCLVFLFNPTINIVDILPDFIAWFLLAKIFERAADSAAYFEEARISFMRLGWINLFKPLIFILVLFLKGSNPINGDTFALVSLVFSALEIIFIIPAVKNIFEAVFHVGERSEAKSLITPISVGKRNYRTLAPESLRGLTMLFLISKSLLSAMPDLFLLSGDADSGHVMTLSRYYPSVLIASLILGFTVGGVWLAKMVKYIKTIHSEGLFFSALEAIATETSKEKFEAKLKIRKMSFALTVLAIASFFSLDLTVSSQKYGIFSNGANILPRFIYGVFLIVFAILIMRHTKSKIFPIISASLYTVFATLAFVFHTMFLSNYEYIDLTAKAEARTAYLFVEIFGSLEFVALTITLLIMAKQLLTDFILTNTGTSPESDRYRRTEREYHKSLLKKTYVLTGLGILGGFTKFINIFLNKEVQLIFSDITDLSRPSFSASALPWFNLVVSAVSIIYIGYSLYYSSTMKEEINMKYIFE